MAENSKIAWTDHTFNPWIGCTKVGPPCDHCYAEQLNKRHGWAGWGPGEPRHRTSANTWRTPRRWNNAIARTGGRARVFCASLADWLDNEVPESWRADLLELIAATPSLDWLLLTKRIVNLSKLVPAWAQESAPANVWLGITCGDQLEFDRDWPNLLKIKAPVRFISHEPALGPLRLSDDLADPDWIIDGGESGPQARPFSIDDSLRLEHECVNRGVAYFRKQLGHRAVLGGAPYLTTGKSDDPAQWPVQWRRQEFPTPMVTYDGWG